MPRDTWKKLVVGGALIGAMVPVLVRAEPRSGHIIVGNPTTDRVSGVSEFLGACEEGTAFDGIDGVWFNISGLGTRTAILTMDATLDADAWFYTDSCDLIDGGQLTGKELGGVEEGIIPSNAGWVVVDGWAGTGNFTIDIL